MSQPLSKTPPIQVYVAVRKLNGHQWSSRSNERSVYQKINHAVGQLHEKLRSCPNDRTFALGDRDTTAGARTNDQEVGDNNSYSIPTTYLLL